jgi:hypothetical protein
MRFTCVPVQAIPVTWSLHGTAAAHLRLGNLYIPDRDICSLILVFGVLLSSG